MRRLLVGAAALSLALAAGTAAVQAAAYDETGIAGIHAWVRVGRKTCMADHFHDGLGRGPTRLYAERAAIRAWAEFTGWEYGGAWGRYALAANRRATCSREEGGWRCAVEARPCRPF
jgi:hypothetical protein